MSEHGGDNSGKEPGDYQSHSRASSGNRGRSEAQGRRYGADIPPVDDYDWYDKDGMRIRVREI